MTTRSGLCDARLQSEILGDDNPFRCDKPHAHAGPHECSCGCGKQWTDYWQSYDLLDGKEVYYRHAPPTEEGMEFASQPRIIRPGDEPGTWNIVRANGSPVTRNAKPRVVWENYSERFME